MGLKGLNLSPLPTPSSGTTVCAKQSSQTKSCISFLVWILLQCEGWWELVELGWTRSFPCSPAQPPGFGAQCGPWERCSPWSWAPANLIWANCGPIILCAPLAWSMWILNLVCQHRRPNTEPIRENFGSKMVPIQELEHQQHSINLFLFIIKINLNFAVVPQVCLQHTTFPKSSFIPIFFSPNTLPNANCFVSLVALELGEFGEGLGVLVPLPSTGWLERHHMCLCN